MILGAEIVIFWKIFTPALAPPLFKDLLCKFSINGVLNNILLSNGTTTFTNPTQSLREYFHFAKSCHQLKQGYKTLAKSAVGCSKANDRNLWEIKG